MAPARVDLAERLSALEGEGLSDWPLLTAEPILSPPGWASTPTRGP